MIVGYVVDKKSIDSVITNLNYMLSKGFVSKDKTFKYASLCRAQGIFTSLESLGLLTEFQLNKISNELKELEEEI